MDISHRIRKVITNTSEIIMMIILIVFWSFFGGEKVKDKTVTQVPCACGREGTTVTAIPPPMHKSKTLNKKTVQHNVDDDILTKLWFLRAHR
jgi:hypothetical protein